MPAFIHGGVSLSYTDRGFGPVIVFQHGLGADASQPASQAPDGYRVVTLECRGHGSSGLGPETDLSFATFASDLAALLNHLEIESACLAGISMGAGVVLAFAQLNPDRVKSLVLIRPAWRGNRRPANLLVFKEIARYIREYGPDEGKHRFVDQSGLIGPIAAVSPAIQRSLLGQFDRREARSNVAVLERLVDDQPLVRGPRALHAVGVPSMVVGTRTDPIHPISHAVWLADRLPTSKLVIVPGRDRDAIHRQTISHAIADFQETVLNQSKVATVAPRSHVAVIGKECS